MKYTTDTDYISFLPRLRAGDRVTYGGTQWEVRDFSTYDDANGYEMMEWLLHPDKSVYSSGSNFYLLREVDPDNPETKVNWYFSEEINADRISGEHVGDNLRYTLWESLHNHREPYPKLRALGRLYYFESQTEGDYKSEDGSESRTTWDYWDEEHLWNLAIEAWQDRELHVYSTKKVKPEDFAIAEKSVNLQSANLQSTNSKSLVTSTILKSNTIKKARTWEWICAWGLVIVGIILMMSGGR